MKNRLLLFLSGALVCVIITSFISRHHNNAEAAVRITPGAVACIQPVIAGIPFIAMSAPSVVMIRKSVYSLSPAEITALKKGIAAMKALPLTDPTSWQYQAAIHGTLLTNHLPQWNSCQHGTPFFFSWHRMYLYFFERILRAKSGNPNLTLPYWDYQSNPVLPPDYRTPGNPLYDGTRFASINAGGSLPAGIMTAFANSLNDIPYFDFQTDIEAPHGSVHGAIGGNMHAVPTAALDPCFWLHHTNIDRLWEVWLKKCHGRENPPATDPWTAKQYTFYDENGNAVVMTDAQVVNTAASLNYRYDLPITLPCDIKIKWWLWKWRWWELLRISRTVMISEKLTNMDFREAKPDSLRKFMQETKTTRFSFPDSGPSDKIFVELRDLAIEKSPEGAVEIYLNLKPGERPSPGSASFAGVLDLFTATGHSGHGMNEAKLLRINVTSAIKKLQLGPADLAKAVVTFYVRGNIVKQQEINTTARISASSMVLGVEKAGAAQ